jgi:hypothetical protein
MSMFWILVVATPLPHPVVASEPCRSVSHLMTELASGSEKFDRSVDRPAGEFSVRNMCSNNTSKSFGAARE